jgi:NAD(P)-dependent dehydrogenase (short-subunit alcohol dehydrogenase family)
MATLKGQTILIIGGSSGIGYGVALAALQSHASKVIIASSSQERLHEAEKRLREDAGILSGLFGGDIETRLLNAKDLNSVKTVVEGVGEIDHLVFTSGDRLKMTNFKTAEVGAMKGLQINSLFK